MDEGWSSVGRGSVGRGLVGAGLVGTRLVGAGSMGRGSLGGVSVGGGSARSGSRGWLSTSAALSLMECKGREEKSLSISNRIFLLLLWDLEGFIFVQGGLSEGWRSQEGWCWS